MEDVIYLICNKDKVEGMRKTLPYVKRSEIVVKLNVEVAPKAFGSPTIEKQVYIEDWTKGIDIEDVEFKKNIITEEEAEIIRAKRLAKMKEILKSQGYTVKEPETKEKKEKQ